MSLRSWHPGHPLCQGWWTGSKAGFTFVRHTAVFVSGFLAAQARGASQSPAISCQYWCCGGGACVCHTHNVARCGNGPSARNPPRGSVWLARRWADMDAWACEALPATPPSRTEGAMLSPILRGCVKPAGGSREEEEGEGRRKRREESDRRRTPPARGTRA